MSKPKSVYLTERSMSALRGDEALSARLNQIVDRYLTLVALYGEGLRVRFGDMDWQNVCRVYPKVQRNKHSVHQVCESMRLLLGEEFPETLNYFQTAELAALYELIEAEVMSDTPPTHS